MPRRLREPLPIWGTRLLVIVGRVVAPSVAGSCLRALLLWRVHIQSACVGARGGSCTVFCVSCVVALLRCILLCLVCHHCCLVVNTPTRSQQKKDARTYLHFCLLLGSVASAASHKYIAVVIGHSLSRSEWLQCGSSVGRHTAASQCSCLAWLGSSRVCGGPRQQQLCTAQCSLACSLMAICVRLCCFTSMLCWCGCDVVPLLSRLK